MMLTGYCGHCGCYHSGPCPRIKAIEYYENGTIKRVEYFDQRPQVSTVQPMTTVWLNEGKAA